LLNSTETIARIGRAERESTLSLHRAAAATASAGCLDIEGVNIAWSRCDGDPGYASLENLEDVPDPLALLPQIENTFCARGGPVLGIRVAPTVDPRLAADQLLQRGYQLDYEESVWARPLDADSLDFVPTADPRLEIVETNDGETFASIFNRGRNLPPDAMPGRIVASAIGSPGWRHYLASFDDEAGAVAALFIEDSVAQFFVATTTPEHHGNGAQDALIRRRLVDALEAGCDLASSQTVNGGAESRYLCQHGFRTLYRRSIFGKRLRPVSASPQARSSRTSR